jgi:hypothetical protein
MHSIVGARSASRSTHARRSRVRGRRAPDELHSSDEPTRSLAHAHSHATRDTQPTTHTEVHVHTAHTKTRATNRARDRKAHRTARHRRGRSNARGRHRPSAGRVRPPFKCALAVECMHRSCIVSRVRSIAHVRACTGSRVSIGAGAVRRSVRSHAHPTRSSHAQVPASRV